MSSVATLNHPQRCVQELNDFDCAMGWAFQDLTCHDNDEESDDESDRGHRRSVTLRPEIPLEFVAPCGHYTKPKCKKHKKPPVRSAAYSVRPTASSNTSDKTSAPSQPHQQRPRSHHRQSPAPRDKDSVDFVYDLSVRRALRERMDAERLETLRRANAKEAQLKADHQWINDTNSRKQPWSPFITPKPHAKPRRTAAAKTAIAPNLSEWRTQETPFHKAQPTRYDQQQQQRHHQQHQRDIDEVEHSLDAFERQWCTDT